MRDGSENIVRALVDVDTTRHAFNFDARANRFELFIHVAEGGRKGVVLTNSGTDVSNNCSTGHMRKNPHRKVV
jgi:hypothetical protein